MYNLVKCKNFFFVLVQSGLSINRSVDAMNNDICVMEKPTGGEVMKANNDLEPRTWRLSEV